MKCLICGRLSLPGAKLCLDCKAARKRAFDATVTQPLLAAAGVAGATRGRPSAPRLLKPSQSGPDAARRAAKLALAAQAKSKIADAVAAEASPRRAGRWPIVIGAVCLVVAVAGYFGHWFGGTKSDTFAVVPERPAVESPTAPSIAPASTPGAIASPSAAATPVPAGSAAAIVEPPIPATKGDAPKRPRRTEKAPVAPPPPEPAPPPPVVVAAPAPPPPVVREAPRVDPFQAMNDAIARCPRDDISGRASCEQRLRAQYCEGHWGQVPQCASIPYVDHGQ
jgi:hypothetical protein